MEESYKKKLKLISQGLSDLCDPYKVPMEMWSDDISLWPDLEFGQLYMYLVSTTGEFTKEMLKNYKSLDAYNYYASGWVQTIYFHDMEQGINCVLKGKVKASQRLNDPPHEAWVCLHKKTADVVTGHCSCMAGKGGTCSHVAGILFKIEACARLGIVKMSCTSLPCVWNQSFSKNVNPSPASEIKFFKPKHSQKDTATSNLPKSTAVAVTRMPPTITIPTTTSLRPASTVTTTVASITATVAIPAATSATVTPAIPCLDKNIVYSKLNAVCPKAVVFTVLPGFTISGEVSDEREPNLPFPLCEFYKPHYKSLTQTAFTQLISETFLRIKISKEEASFLELTTRKQTTSWEWFHYRTGLITASHFHDVIHHSWRTIPKSKIKAIMQYDKPNADLPALKWGRENEDAGIKQYMAEFGRKHVNLKYERAGLSIDTHHPYLGATPDGVISCDCCGFGLIEVKCTYKYRNESPTCPEALADKNYFLKKDQSGKVSLDIKHKYHAQVQVQLSICEHPYCDFICWTTEGIFVQRIAKDEDFLSKHLPQLKRYFIEYLLPEILTHRLLVSSEEPCSASINDVYCLCRKEEYGEMIACDNSSCTVEWFHMDCVKLNKAPKGKWFCPTCRKK